MRRMAAWLLGLALVLIPAAAQQEQPPKVTPPKLVKSAPPEYPSLARRARVEGVVQVRLLVTKEGSVGQADVLRGHPLLQTAALAAVSKWQYQPAEHEGKAVDSAITVDVNFALEPGDLERPHPVRSPYIKVEQVKLVKQVHPVYPPLARRAGVEGRVVVAIVIGEDGKVKQAEVMSGHPLLMQAAIDAVRQSEYQPILLNGKPIEATANVTVVFELAAEWM